jgi:hypothetical protein
MTKPRFPDMNEIKTLKHLEQGRMTKPRFTDMNEIKTLKHLELGLHD